MVTFLLKETYIKLIKNSIGTKMFNSYYVKDGKLKKDILKNGEFSCAFFVSSILKIFGWVNKIHLSVDETEEDLTKNGWEEGNLKDIEKGCVIVWKGKKFKEGCHKHIGFYLGNKKAISTSFKGRKVVLHDWTFRNRRKIISVYCLGWRN